ncbi:hypothetical protein [Poseidonibacter ostreae]|uniref:Uncharacterized protein n=1 Tax=Poseidonibacter ostreae TaxID=2654171 RepID=A0A6L4WNA3_9BACT|nr:hypothetical protein [Poseidonibacter ostreae]KAB7884674.1 hypothetical protein GBG19_15460 [Poseidonibacter ostreae]KAB7885179.1 hypothetical protein GA417_09105 [Poseidonibacter ostreae]KAB7889589.1 hypothetical protein GBG18_10570 [Poseidonibacter ostreae]
MNIKFIFLVFYFFVSLKAEVNTSSSIKDSRDLAVSLSATAKDAYVNNFDKNIAQPITSESSIETLDGSKSGVINMTCTEAGDNILLSRISINGTNNITLNVELDIDLDGNFEDSLSFDNIGGIHTKGVFTCTGDNLFLCKYYDWNYSLSSKLTLDEIESKDAVSPYCINDICGSVYSTDSSQILNDVGGAIVALVQTTTNLMVTRIEPSSSYVNIYAQKYDNCSSASTLYNSSNGSIPSNATLISQASLIPSTNESKLLLSSVAVNESKNIIAAEELDDIKLVTSIAKSSVSIDSNNPRDISYTSVYKDENGNLITKNDTTSVNFKHIDPEYCMVEWYETYTSVTTDNNVRGVSASGLTQTKKSESRLCTGEYNNICPVLNSETIKYDCGNLDKSINQGIAALNTMEKVVKDMICNITN